MHMYYCSFFKICTSKVIKKIQLNEVCVRFDLNFTSNKKTFLQDILEILKRKFQNFENFFKKIFSLYNMHIDVCSSAGTIFYYSKIVSFSQYIPKIIYC